MISEQPLYNNDSGMFYKVSVYMYKKTPTIPSNLWGICKLNGDLSFKHSSKYRRIIIKMRLA